ncbi:MAG: hypothetical protein ACP5NW_00245 [Candidatus Woesearchaeota archaeon]
MKRLNFFSLLFLTIIVSTYSVHAVGIGTYGNEKNIVFEAGMEKTYMFYIYDSQTVVASLEGDLAEYAILKDPNPGGNSRNVEVLLTLPEYLEPGPHTLYITATQAFGETASVGGIASVRTGINVFALYPGKHPVFYGVSTNDLNVNEKTNIGVSLINDGEEAIDGASGTLTVYDPDNNIIAILKTEPQGVGPYETKTIWATLDSALYNMSIGTYRVVGSLMYDGIDVGYTKENSLIVGNMNVDIISTTPEVYVNSTNKYYISISSDWSGDIDNVYARITLPNGKIVKTPGVDLIKPGQGRKAAAEIESFLEIEDIDIGTYDIDVTLYYKGMTTTKTVALSVIDGKAPEIEKAGVITPMNLFIGISVLIIIFVGLYFLVFRKRGNRSQGSDDIKRSNDDIRPPTL